MKKTYKIEVDCANCAARMEASAAKVAGVSAITVNYLTQKMTVEFADGADVTATIQAVAKTCKKVDSDFSIEL